MAAVQQPISPQIVGNAFVEQYYHILHHSPELVYRFFKDDSQLGRPEDDGSVSITTTMDGINAKICSFGYDEYKFEIKSIVSQESLDGGVQVLVTGSLTGGKNTDRKFAQAFFLATQTNGYYVLNDMVSYMDSETVSPAVVDEVVMDPPVAAEPVEHVLEQILPAAEDVEDEVTEEVYNPPENEDVIVVEDVEEVPVPEVVDEVQGDDSQVAVESSAKIEEMPKKSYASLVMDLKESAGSSFPLLVNTRKVPQKSVEMASPNVAPASNGTVSRASAGNGVNQDREAEGYSIYIGGLPMNATNSMVEEVFTKFGTIKSGGIQVRFNNVRDFCFGFVEYEDAGSAQEAVEASPVRVGVRLVDVEEKRSYIRGPNQGTFQFGRGSGFRSEVGRGGRGSRGNYVGGRSNGRDDFNNRGGGGDFNRNESVNRGGNRGGGLPASNRDGGYHQKPESFYNSSSNSNISGGGRTNRNANSKEGDAKPQQGITC